MGNQGNDGLKGATGKPGEGTTVILMPAASAPANLSRTTSPVFLLGFTSHSATS